jgi:transcriptional regulator with XRE-family HTH domain
MTPTQKKRRPLGRPRKTGAASERDSEQRKADGRQINHRLQEIGLSQAKAAELAGMRQGHLNDIVNGERAVGREDLRKLARIGVSADYVLGVSDRPSPWEPVAWTPDHSRAFAVDWFRAEAAPLLAEHLRTVDKLREYLGETTSANLYHESNAILLKVEGLAQRWIADAHRQVRLLVEQESRVTVAAAMGKASGNL